MAGGLEAAIIGSQEKALADPAIRQPLREERAPTIATGA
jgi:hypothetical protein